jgi:hypothetical protein
MPAPLSAELGPLLKAAYPSVRGAVNAGLGLDEIEALLDTLGTPISRGYILSMIRTVKSIIDTPQEVAKQAPDAVLPTGMIPFSDRNLRRDYAWTFSRQWFDPESGTSGRKYVTVATDEQLSFTEASTLADEYFAEGESRYKVLLSRPVFVGIEQRAT